MSCLEAQEITTILDAASEMKENPDLFSNRMANESLFMLFSKPSLRTRVSFEVGMTQLGGHGIYYPLDSKATLGQKETIEDFSKVISRYCSVVMARVKSRDDVRAIAKHATVPVINALDDWGHPCQILADFQTIREHVSKDLRGKKLTFVGDVRNNVTYDLMRGCAIMGMDVAVAGPIHDAEYEVEQEVLDEVNQLAAQAGGKVLVTADPKEAVAGADVVYADSLMSYGIDPELAAKRDAVFAPYQVTEELMAAAKPDTKFMHCLPAWRGAEVTAGVIDGTNSVVFDQAENRLHAQKALMLFLRNKL